MPLDPNDIKGELAHRYLESVVTSEGFSFTRPLRDFGIDLVLEHIARRQSPNGVRLVRSPTTVDVQLKATCDSNVEYDTGHVRYDIPAKNYNDLVERRISGAATPLILVLLVLPDDSADWTALLTDRLELRRCAFWYRPAADASLTENTGTKRISIPLANLVTSGFVAHRFAEFFQ